MAHIGGDSSLSRLPWTPPSIPPPHAGVPDWSGCRTRRTRMSDDGRMAPPPLELVADRLAPFGPYFRLQVNGSGLPVNAASRIRALRPTLTGPRAHSVADRVVAGTAHLDLAAHLVSPLIGAAVVCDVGLMLPELRLVPGRPVPVVPPLTPTREPDQLWADQVLAGPVAELDAAFAAILPNAAIRSGNVASAVHGCGLVLRSVAPETAERTNSLVNLLLLHPRLRSSWTAPPFIRNSCCLLYRATRPERYCGDCVLRRRGT